MQTLEGRTVLVVGGTSGIGLAVARGAQELGAEVIVVGRSAERLAEVTRLLGAGAHAVVGDVARPDGLLAALEPRAAIDHVVITAGTVAGGPLAGLTEGEMDRIWRERIAGPLLLLQTLARRRTLDSVVLTSGLLAHRPAAGTALLAAACAAIEALVAALAAELAPTRVNAIAPGFTDTPLLDAAAALFGVPDRSTLVTAATSGLPVPRAGRADEVAAAVLFLLRNGYVTGETISVDGGARWR